MKLKLLSWILVILSMTAIAYAVTSQVTSFNGQSNPFNATFDTINKNRSYPITFPSYAYVNNLSFLLQIVGDTANQTLPIQTGFNNSANTLTDATNNGWNDTGLFIADINQITCSNCTSGNCSYFANYTIDGYPYYYLYHNISNPVKTNFELPCLSQNTLQILTYLYLDAGGWHSHIRCYDYTSQNYDIQFNLLGETQICYSYINYTVFPQNISIYVDGEFNRNVSVPISNTVKEINLSKINQPKNWNITFFSLYPNKLQINLTNATYSYGIDNCSGIGIPSNATALNITWQDVNGNKANVNYTSLITYGSNSYYTYANNANNSKYCIYPSWFNYTGAIQVDYIDSVSNHYQYIEPILLFDNSTYQLPLYITTGSAETTFTIKDKNTNNVLSDVLCTSYLQIGGTYVGAESKISDITGKIIFNYLPYTNYKFMCSKNGYQTLIFYLSPPIGDYTVPMIPTSTINFTIDYDRVAISYSPSIFQEGNNNFTWIISGLNELSSYGYTLTYPGGTSSNIGYNPNGEQLNSTFTISGSTSSDLLRLDYYYQRDGINNKTFTYYFSISNPSTNNTFVALKNQTYGLGILERVIICLFIAIFIVGIASWMGQLMPGFGLALLVLVYLTYIGFYPFWAGLVTCIMSSLLIFTKVEY